MDVVVRSVRSVTPRIKSFELADPTGAPCGRLERFAFFDDVANEEVLWNDEKIYDREGFQVVVHQQQVWVVACNKALTFRLVGAISNLCAELPFLALELEFFIAC